VWRTGTPEGAAGEPRTFMNSSGIAIATMVQEHSIPLEHLIVIHDEMDLPVGTVRVSFNASAAGHNGDSVDH